MKYLFVCLFCLIICLFVCLSVCNRRNGLFVFYGTYDKYCGCCSKAPDLTILTKILCVRTVFTCISQPQGLVSFNIKYIIHSYFISFTKKLCTVTANLENMHNENIFVCA